MAMAPTAYLHPGHLTSRKVRKGVAVIPLHTPMADVDARPNADVPNASVCGVSVELDRSEP